MSEAVHLWDGRTYCAECVRQTSPKLLEYARAHSDYEESFQLRQRRPLRLYMKYNVICLALALVGLAFYIQEPLAAIPFLLICLMLWHGVNTLLPNRLRRWEVTIRSGIVSVEEFGNPLPVQARLERTRWDVAGAGGATGRMLYEFPHTRAILISLGHSKTSWLDAPPFKVPCGVTPDAFEVLAAFLTLSGIPNAAAEKK